MKLFYFFFLFQPKKTESKTKRNGKIYPFIEQNTVKPRLFEVPGTAGILSNNR